MRFGYVLFIGSLMTAGVGEGADKKFQHTPDELKIWELTNLERKGKDKMPLKLNPALSKLARAHSENMAKQQKQDHTLDGKTPFDRLREAGYKYFKAGENIGSADGGTIDMVMKAWMDSKGHAENILNPDYAEIGVGIARDKDGVTYYTQLFAKPRK
ncbi:MAG: CAP domain-containing protein [Planctomycetes bacterium]|nr:CAP domain-containing protein [Planctomycetota bacterium]